MIERGIRRHAELELVWWFDDIEKRFEAYRVTSRVVGIAAVAL